MMTPDHIAQQYGQCKRAQKYLQGKSSRNECYWAEEGCLRMGWKGIICPHWRGMTAEEFHSEDRLKNYAG